MKRPVNSHNAYHAHVYFEQETLEFASWLCAEAGKLFTFRVGRIHEKLIGPQIGWGIALNSIYPYLVPDMGSIAHALDLASVPHLIDGYGIYMHEKEPVRREIQTLP